MTRQSLSSDIAAALDLGGDFAFALAEGSSFDRVAVVVPDGVDAVKAATGLANFPVNQIGDGADAVWDRLAAGVRRAAVLRDQKTLVAAAFAWRGRGRILGPLRADLLIRFGVSTWR